MGMNGAGGASEGRSPGGPGGVGRWAGDGDARRRPSSQRGNLQLPLPTPPGGHPALNLTLGPDGHTDGQRGSEIQLPAVVEAEARLRGGTGILGWHPRKDMRAGAQVRQVPS